MAETMVERVADALRREYANGVVARHPAELPIDVRKPLPEPPLPT
jgi:hypothetical protein